MTAASCICAPAMPPTSRPKSAARWSPFHPSSCTGSRRSPAAPANRWWYGRKEKPSDERLCAIFAPAALGGPLVAWDNAFSDRPNWTASLPRAMRLHRPRRACSWIIRKQRKIRITDVAWLARDAETEWLYRRLGEIVQRLNIQFYKYDLVRAFRNGCNTRSIMAAKAATIAGMLITARPRRAHASCRCRCN